MVNDQINFGDRKMSYSTALKVYKSKVTCFEEYGNGFGSGPVLWDLLCNKYLNLESYLCLFSFLEKKDETEKLWSLVDSKDLTIGERLALFLTFDRAVINREHFELCADGFPKVYEEMKNKNPNYANHWLSLSEFFKANIKKKDSRLIGLGLDCTSVADTWDGYPKEGKKIIESSKELSI